MVGALVAAGRRCGRHWCSVVLHGGSRPYGYMGIGLSELVFVFFGLVATVGTTYVQTTNVPWWVWCGASGIGLISVALLLVNNIRDIPTDSQVGKNTAAVRLGDRASRGAYLVTTAGGLILGSLTLAGGGSSHCGLPPRCSCSRGCREQSLSPWAQRGLSPVLW